MPAIPEPRGLFPQAAVAAVGLGLPLLAMSTVRPVYQGNYVQHELWLTLVIVELVVIALCWADGFRVFRAIHSMPQLARLGLAILLLAIAFAAASAPFRALALVHAGISTINILFCLALWDRLTSAWAAFRLHFLWALAAGVACYAAIAAASAMFLIEPTRETVVHFGVAVSNLRHIGFFGVTLAGLAAGFMLTSVPYRARWWLCFFLLLVGVFLSCWGGGRGSFLATVAAMVVALAIAPSGRIAFLGACLAAFPIAAVLSDALALGPLWGFGSIIGRAEVLNGEFNDSGRLAIWKEALELWWTRPILGFGETQFRWIATTARERINHPHNGLVQVLFQWGLAGLAGLAVLMGSLLARTRKIWTRRAESLPAIVALSGLFASSFVDGVFYFLYPRMVIAVGLAVICAGLCRPKDDTATAGEIAQPVS